MRHIPLLAIVLIIYNAIAFTSSGFLANTVAGFTLPSGAAWSLLGADLLVALALFLLYLEILKATRTSAASIIDHALSLVIFIICLIQFLLMPAFGTAAFFMITLITLIDVIAGFTVTISGARRDVGLDQGMRF